jgi:tetratricopeptide (TPR) repeat protein
MKKQLLMLALSGLTTLTYSQKNEVKALEKAVKSEKFNETNSLISSAEALIANADDKTKSKFYYLKVKAMLAGNDYEGIISSLAEFDANNTSKYKKEIEALKEQKTNLLINSAISDQKQNLNVKSAEKLFTAYQLSGDLQYLYYASSGYVNAKDYKKALPMYIELKEKKYTGIKTQFLAYNKATKKDDVFQDKIMRSLALKSGTHLKPTERQTESALPNIVKNIALIYVDLGDTDNAIKAVKEARNENPKDLGLILTEANLYLKLNDKVEFKLLMEEAVKQDPSNPKLYFNLGVISAEQEDFVSAKKYYTKSLELNPEDINTNYNMAALVLQEENSLVEKMNLLGNTAVDNRKYDELQNEKNIVYKNAKPYLEKILSIDPKNESAAITLKGIYSVLGDTAKFKEMKALLESL